MENAGKKFRFRRQQIQYCTCWVWKDFRPPRWDNSRHLEAWQCPVRGSLWLPGHAWGRLDSLRDGWVVTKWENFILWRRHCSLLRMAAVIEMSSLKTPLLISSSGPWAPLTKKWQNKCISRWPRALGRELGVLKFWVWVPILSVGKSVHGEGNCNPLQYSCPGNPMDGGAWGATVHGVAKSRTRLSDFTHSLTQVSSLPETLSFF